MESGHDGLQCISFNNEMMSASEGEGEGEGGGGGGRGRGRGVVILPGLFHLPSVCMIHTLALPTTSLRP